MALRDQLKVLYENEFTGANREGTMVRAPCASPSLARCAPIVARPSYHRFS